jgi:hypothetical protein
MTAFDWFMGGMMWGMLLSAVLFVIVYYIENGGDDSDE